MLRTAPAVVAALACLWAWTLPRSLLRVADAATWLARAALLAFVACVVATAVLLALRRRDWLARRRASMSAWFAGFFALQLLLSGALRHAHGGGDTGATSRIHTGWFANAPWPALALEWPAVDAALRVTLGDALLMAATAGLLALLIGLARTSGVASGSRTALAAGVGSAFSSACAACPPLALATLAILAPVVRLVSPSAVSSWLEPVMRLGVPLLALLAIHRVALAPPDPAPPTKPRPFRLAVPMVILILFAVPTAAAVLNMPRGASDRQQLTAALFIWTLAGAILLTGIVVAGVLYFAWRFRDSGTEPPIGPRMGRIARRAYIASAVVLPSVVIFGLGALSHAVLAELEEPPQEAVHVEVHALRFAWRFTYPDGSTSIDELRIEENRMVVLHLTSADVIHSLFIPEMGVKRDAMPGVETQAWFRPHRSGSYDASCAEFCGAQHAGMRATVVVFPAGSQARPYG